MSTQNPNEVWQVEVGGQVYEAPFAELGDWIGEGSLLPQDKVRRGNLRWIEARRVPNLDLRQYGRVAQDSSNGIYLIVIQQIAPKKIGGGYQPDGIRF